MEAEELVLEDCRRVIAKCTDPSLLNIAPLAHAVLCAFASSHREAAMALAVSIGEPLAKWASEPRVEMFRSEARARRVGEAEQEDQPVQPGQVGNHADEDQSRAYGI